MKFQNLQEFTITAPRINKPTQTPPNNSLYNGDTRMGPGGQSMYPRQLVEAFKPEFDAELKQNPDSTAAFNNMLSNRQLNLPRTRLTPQANPINLDFMRKQIINRSPNYKPLSFNNGGILNYLQYFK
jgi:hypothetical protein